MKKFCNILLIGLSLYCSEGTAQHQDTIVQRLYSYLSSTKEEKLFLHVDKESCQAGDTLWFRGYLLGAINNSMADLSRYIYVELIDRNDIVQWREKIGLSQEDSVFKGYFPISEGLKQGDYILRAYTYWMQNQDDAFQFTKRIRIVNPYDHKINIKMDIVREGNKRTLRVVFLNQDGERYENLPFIYKIPGETPPNTYEWSNTGYNGMSRITIKNSDSDHIWIRAANSSEWDIEQYLRIPGTLLDFDVQFFPEGGDLITNTNQRIAFKAVRRDGLGIEIEGEIKDNYDNVIARIESNHLGFGSVILNLAHDKEYRATIRGKDGKVKEFVLPTMRSNKSCALKISSKGENVYYDILSHGTNDFSDKTLLIHSKGIPLAIFNAESMRNKLLSFEESPEGILHFLLLDSSMNVLSERLWFHMSNNRATLTIDYPNKRTKPRANVMLNLKLLNVDSQNINGNFSISVVNNGETQCDISNGGIESYLLLTSDLSGYIETPGYYFTSSDTNCITDLDNLMLTQGWKRFNVEQILNGNASKNTPFYMERGQFLSGYVKNFRGKHSVNSEIILLGSNGIVRELRTDSLGYFIENDLWYDIGTRFIVQAISEKGKTNLELQLEDPEFRTFYPVNNVLGECESNEEFYQKYGKDYIFADNGERIKTLGVVRVYGSGIAKMQEELKQAVEFDARRNFLLGMTGIRTWGSAPGDWSGETINTYYRPAYHFAYAQRTDKLEEKRRKYQADNYHSSYYSNSYSKTEFEMAFYQSQIDQAFTEELSNNGIMNGSRATTIINDNSVGGYNGVLGVTLHHPFLNSGSLIRNPTDPEAQAVVFTPVYDIAIHSVDYQFNMQTIVPFAPQQNNVEFYVPSYNVDTELLKEMVDEKITRYWNPNVKLSSDKPFEFTFPTADGAGNRSYTITIEGITENGTPIHKTFQYSL